MPTLYQIKDWNLVFHSAEANRNAEVLWMRFPVSHDSVRYKRLMATSEGRDAFTVFVAVCQMVARARSQGVLVTGRTPIEVEDVAASTGSPLSVVETSFRLLKSSKIGWLEPYDGPLPHEAPPGQRPGDNRATPGRQPGNARTTPGQRPVPRAARQQCAKTKYKKTLPCCFKASQQSNSAQCCGN